MERGASDLHLRSGATPLMRDGGEIVRLEDHPVLEAEGVAAMLFAALP
jgi:Tfp pilus assembly pilus retraction ATPase PilT